MANTSILNAFERMWQHTTAALNNKSDKADVEELQNLVGDTPIPEQVDTLINNIDNLVYVNEESQEYATVPLNADTLGGHTVDTLIDKIYPIGNIYMSINSTSPAELFGGSWERLKDTFLLASGDTYEAGTTGGEATHTLTTNEIPSHNHGAYGWAEVVDGSGSYKTLGAEGLSNTYSTRATGGSQPHNNMPPYLAVYMWKRIA